MSNQLHIISDSCQRCCRLKPLCCKEVAGQGIVCAFQASIRLSRFPLGLTVSRIGEQCMAFAQSQ